MVGIRKPHRKSTALITAVLFSALGLAAPANAAPARPAPAKAAPVHNTHQIKPHSQVAGAGATVPFTEYAAVNAATNGTLIGPSNTFGTLASEAVGRRAVTLNGQGKYIEFTLTQAANAVDFHYSIPDSSNGSGITDPLALYVNGQKNTDLTLTSKYDWFYGSYPFSNNPGDGGAHHFYDDVRTMFSSTLPIGTKVRLQVDSGDNAPSYTVDVADFENVAAPLTEPSGYLSVTDYGADPTGATDSTQAIQNAINAGQSQGKGVWIPKGTFTVTSHLIVNKVTLAGAGPWYSVLHGPNVGVYGNAAPNPSGAVHLSDFAIFGEVTDRNDSAQVNGVGGAIGGGSTISDLWIQHTKVGMWFDGPFDGLTISGTRIQDTTADGINFHDGISNATVKQTFVRNTGDDGLAMWSDQNADHNNTFDHNTVELPILANNFAIYGGHDNAITYNVGTDTLTQGGGIQVANRFSSVPLSGTTTVDNNLLQRTGVLDPNWQFGVGAIWFYANDSAMTGTVNVDHNEMDNSSYEAIQFIGSSVSNVEFTDDTINTAGTFAVQEQSSGSANFSYVTATNLGDGGIYNCGVQFTITQGPGNSGWSDSHCGFPSLQTSPSSLSFGAQKVGSTSSAQQVTVKNPGSSAVSVGGINTNGDYAETNNCGSSLAAGASCTVNVTFTPTTTGDRTGTLTISSSTQQTVALDGSGTGGGGGGGNLALNQPITATSVQQNYGASNADDGNSSTYWESANNTFPQTPQSITVDLGSAQSVGKLILDLPPSTAWNTRTETLSVLGSTDGSSYSTIAGSQGYTFNPSTGNTVTIPLPTTTARYLRLTITANTGWPAGQLSEFQVYAP